jgi:hypothetical protein
MITISVLPMTEHLKQNQTSIKITIAERDYRFTTFSNKISTIIGLTLLALIMRPFPATKQRLVI